MTFPRHAVTAALTMAVMVATADVATAQASEPAAAEVVVEVRIHGNYTTPDADVLQIAGLTIGQPLDAETVREVERRLRRSGRFEDVEIRKRYRSLAESSEVVLIIVVREHPVPDEGPPVLRPLKQVAGSMLLLPILDYVDGYGFTYGGRVTFAGALGNDSRISVPATWGGTKRVAVEFDKSFARGPFTRVSGGAALSRQKDPYFQLDEDRREAWIEGRRHVTRSVSVGVRGGLADVTFGELDDRLAAVGADVTLDTRADPVFPRDAIFASASWDVLDPRGSSSVSRYRLDARGYIGLIGQSVLSVRWQFGASNGPLPSYERFLLGGASTLRGYRAGSFSGDRLMAASTEVRVPLSSPMGISRAGITLFADVGAAYDRGVRLADTRFHVGGGGGVFLVASLFRVNLDIGFREGGGTPDPLRDGCAVLGVGTHFATYDSVYRTVSGE